MSEQVWQAKVVFRELGTAQSMHRTRTGAIRQVQEFLDEKDIPADAASMFDDRDDGLCVWPLRLESVLEIWVRPFQLKD